MIIVLLYIMGVITLLIEIFGGKPLALLKNPELYLQIIETENPYVIWIGRTGTALFLLGIALVITHGLYVRKGRIPRQGLSLLMAWLGIYIPPVLSGLLSESGKFSYKILFFPLLLIAAYLSPRFNITEKSTKLLIILLSFIYASLLGIILRPDWAYAEYSESWIGIPIRLFGAASHPNGLGAIALAALLLLQLSENTRKSLWRSVHWLAIITVIILAQSKTIWIVCFVLFVVRIMVKKMPTKAMQIQLGITSVLFFLLFLTTLALVFWQTIPISEKLFPTLIGRTHVWKVTWQVWLESPILGYGPNLWDLDFRKQTGYLWAGQAHNQILQTLGESGLLGVSALVLFYLTLFKESSRLGNMDEIVSFTRFGFTVLILLRSFTEAPLRNYIIDTNFIINAIIYLLMINSNWNARSTTEKKRVLG